MRRSLGRIRISRRSRLGRAAADGSASAQATPTTGARRAATSGDSGDSPSTDRINRRRGSRASDWSISHTRPGEAPMRSTTSAARSISDSTSACQRSSATYSRAAPSSGSGSSGLPIATTGPTASRAAVLCSSAVGSASRPAHQRASGPRSASMSCEPSSWNERRYSTGGRGSAAIASAAVGAACRWLRRHSRHTANSST